MPLSMPPETTAARASSGPPASGPGRAGAVAWTKPVKKPNMKQTQPSMPPDTVEEALPEAPSWSMPGRALEERDTGRGWGENTGRLARRKPGLGQDRGSLKRPRGDDGPTGSSPRPTTGTQSRPTGSGRTPVDDREPTKRTRAPESRPGSSGARSNPGMPGSELRGRPPGSLYADEASSPPGDPLMAALVSGEEQAATGEPPPVHPLYPQGMPSDSDFGAFDDLPPTRATLEDDRSPLGLRPPGPRVVPPSTGRRTSTMGGRRGGSGTGSRDPRGNRVASAPSMPGGILPDAPRAPARGMPTPTPLERNTQPPGEGLSAVAPEPVVVDDDPLADLLPELPMPPPPDLEKQFGRSRDERRRTIRALAIGIAVAVLLVAANDSWKMFSHIGSLNAALGTGSQATPALKRKLDAEVSRLGLGSSLERGWATIDGTNDQFHIGVEVRHRILGVPMTYEASKSGSFRVGSKLPTLEYFTDGGWRLDDSAQQALREYQASRRR